MYFLTGLPASGKTHWGQIWAEKANLPFADLDIAVEKEAGCTIEALFEKEGEKGFRNREAVALQELIAVGNPQTIVATGGGTPAFGANVALMKTAGTVVYLAAPIALLAQCIFLQKPTRPLFKNCNSVAEVETVLEQLLVDRAPFYESAHLVLEVEKLSSATFEETIQCFTVRP